VSDEAIAINGWTIYAHPLFLDQLEALITAVEKARAEDPRGYKKKPSGKTACRGGPQNRPSRTSPPIRPATSSRQGDTLGDD
jgi:toxin YhaV